MTLWTATSDLNDTVEEFDAAFAAAKEADWPTVDARLALYSTLEALYRMREYRKEQLGGQKAYLAAIATQVESEVPEGVVTARGKFVHELVSAPTPQMQPLYPGEDVYPSDQLFPGQNLTWREATDPFVVAAFGQTDQLARYTKIAGLRTLETVVERRNFFSAITRP